MNKSDSERIASVLEKSGFKPAKECDEANLIVINICSVRQSAVDRAKARIKKTRQESKAKIALTGCILDEDKKKINQFCDLIFTTNQIAYLPFLLNKIGFQIKIGTDSKIKHYLKIEPKNQSSFSAYIPIMTGCNNFCSYCVVPYVRGKEISRPVQDIICEIKKAVLNGKKEIWLLGQNVNSYSSGKTNFAKLLTRINNIPGNFWIRFTSSHPKDLTNELIETMAKCRKVTPYINLPLQAGDNEILKKMNRRYTVSQYEALVKKIKNSFKKHRSDIEKEIAVSSDIIVGFPGENKKQFQNTKNNFKKMGFAFGYIATYSKRPQTAAFNLKDDVPSFEKKRREKELFKILKKSVLNFNKKFLKKTAEVLVIDKKNNFYIGKTRHYQTIRLKSDKNILGNFVKAKIIKTMSYGLEGILIE